MKILIMQPPYPVSQTATAAGECLNWMLTTLSDLQRGKHDLILLPEYANAPGLNTSDSIRKFVNKRGNSFLRKISDFAASLKSSIALGAVTEQGGYWYNSGIFFDPTGCRRFEYRKIHLTDYESGMLGFTSGTCTTVYDHGDVRMSFAICFDQYFPEYFCALAAQKVDMVLCPSYQRSETSNRIRLIAKARALDSGAHIIRSSYSMGESLTGGHSLVASPAGEMLADAGAKPGIISVEIEPGFGYIKPSSYGQELIEHRELLERHRRPSAYRCR
ncbi:MAG: carbon-nitrogen hydrolase family protein [Lentisphaerota bacterium]